MSKRKKTIIISVIIAVAIIIAATTGTMAKNNGEDVTTQLKTREYTVSKGNIVVGIDSTGKIETKKTPHTFEKDTVIEKNYVKVGDSVKKGDKLAEISIAELNKKIQELETKLITAKANLEKAKSDQNIYNLQAEKKKKDTKQTSSLTYEEKVNQANNQIGALETQINELNGNIAGADVQINDLKAQESNRPAQIQQWQGNISDYESKITAAQQKIDILKADTSADHTQEILNLENEIANYKTETANLQNQINALNTRDFAAEINMITTQKETALAQVKKAQTDLDSAKNNLSFIQSAREKEVALENENIALQSKQDNAQNQLQKSVIETAQSEVDVLNEEIKKLKELEKNNSLTAQIDGVVTTLNYSEGDTVLPNKPVAEIGDLGDINLKLVIEPEDIGSVEVGQKAEFYTDAFPAEAFEGEVSSRNIMPNSEGKYEVTVKVPKNDFELLEGMGASATLVVKDKRDVLCLSNKAIKTKEGKQYVQMKNDDGTLYEVEITTGFSNGSVTEIISGLKDGDVVVSEG